MDRLLAHVDGRLPVAQLPIPRGLLEGMFLGIFGRNPGVLGWLNSKRYRTSTYIK